MKKRLRFIGWGSVIAVILVVILLPKIRDFRKEKTGSLKKGIKQQSALVMVRVVKPEILQELIKTSGTLLADEEVELTFEGLGKIEAFYFVEGNHVKKGQLLAKLNDDDLQAQLTKLNLQNKLLQERVDRQKILLAREAISQESYDQLMTDLQSNEAEISLIGVGIDKTEIRAPFDGIIGLRHISEGAYVSPEMQIAKLSKIQPLKIEFSIPERYAGIVRVGNELTFQVENTVEKYSAKVYAIEPDINPGTRTLMLRAMYPNSNARLQPGRFVSVQLVIREKKDALQVPTESIIPESGNEKVFLVKKGKALAVDVKTGLRTPESIEITSGIQSGDSIVISGIMQLRTDMPVTVIEDDSVFTHTGRQ
jgi:membrane fusion protein (multidrug efflux system)